MRLESGLESEQGIDAPESSTVQARTGGGHSSAGLKRTLSLLITLATSVCLAMVFVERSGARGQSTVTPEAKKVNTFDEKILSNMSQLIDDGRQIFRFDTFGDEAFCGDSLMLHQAIEGSKFGGVGPGVSPAAALNLGLKVDIDALSKGAQKDLEKGKFDANDPGKTLALIKANAVLGIKGVFQGDSLKSMGITCALCHSTVDDSAAPGIGHRLDGWANRDLNVGGIIAAAPNLQPVADLLGVNVATLRTVLNSWGPGKFDAEIFLDGKAFNPQQVTDGVVTGANVTGDADSKCIWAGRLQPAYLDRRVGHGPLLECPCG